MLTTLSEPGKFFNFAENILPYTTYQNYNSTW